jgi:hypothetical protein
MSLDQTSGRCQTVPKALSADFLGSIDGYWQGATSFQYVKALYAFEFLSLELTDKQFKHFIQDGYDLSDVSAYNANNTYSNNIVLWMHASVSFKCVYMS